MPNNWTETLRRRRAGDVEGFNGADTPHQDRGRRPTTDTIDAAPPPATKAPAKKAPATKAPARRATKKRG